MSLLTVNLYFRILFVKLSCHQAYGLLGMRLSQPVIISHLLKYSDETVYEDITSGTSLSLYNIVK
jgi:hypothetical protein